MSWHIAMNAVLQRLGAVGGTPGGAANGSAMKNGISAKSISASAFASLVISRPIGMSGNSGWRVVRPNAISARNACLL